MPTHTGPSVNTVKESDNQELLERMEEIRTPIFVIREQLIKHGFIPANHVDGEDCTSSSENCESLKNCI